MNSIRFVLFFIVLLTQIKNHKLKKKQKEVNIFERFDKNMSGKIDANELREALTSSIFVVSPVVLDMLVSKFDKTGGN